MLEDYEAIAAEQARSLAAAGFAIVNRDALEAALARTGIQVTMTNTGQHWYSSWEPLADAILAAIADVGNPLPAAPAAEPSYEAPDPTIRRMYQKALDEAAQPAAPSVAPDPLDVRSMALRYHDAAMRDGGCHGPNPDSWDDHMAFHEAAAREAIYGHSGWTVRIGERPALAGLDVERLRAWFIERGWSIHMQPNGRSVLDPFVDLAARLAAQEPQPEDG
jgi:hypothetical protein